MTESIILLIGIFPLILLVNILTVLWLFDFKSEQIKNIIKSALWEAYIENTKKR